MEQHQEDQTIPCAACDSQGGGMADELRRHVSSRLHVIFLPCLVPALYAQQSKIQQSGGLEVQDCHVTCASVTPVPEPETIYVIHICADRGKVGLLVMPAIDMFEAMLMGWGLAAVLRSLHPGH